MLGREHADRGAHRWHERDQPEPSRDQQRPRDAQHRQVAGVEAVAQVTGVEAVAQVTGLYLAGAAVTRRPPMSPSVTRAQ